MSVNQTQMNTWNLHDCLVVFFSSECRENEQLSKYGDTKTARSIMLVELKKLIEANPLFRDKLAFPTLKSSRLRTLINQRWSWYHTCYYKTRGANIICYTGIYRFFFFDLKVLVHTAWTGSISYARIQGQTQTSRLYSQITHVLQMVLLHLHLSIFQLLQLQNLLLIHHLDFLVYVANICSILLFPWMGIYLSTCIIIFRLSTNTCFVLLLAYSPSHQLEQQLMLVL